MGKYGAVANIGAQLLEIGATKDPRLAWTAAAELVFPNSSSSVDKSCPRDTFLALCETGAVRGIAPGTYTRSVSNKSYALRALEAVRADPDSLSDLTELWRYACSDSAKAHNHQMDVVSSLWHRSWILPA